MPSANLGLFAIQSAQDFSGGSITAGSFLYWNGTSFATAITFPYIYSFSPTLAASSGTEQGMALIVTVNQSGTAGATDLKINRTQTAVGSGQQNLIDALVGGTSKFRVDNTGKILVTTGISANANSQTLIVGNHNFVDTGTQTLIGAGSFSGTPSGTVTQCGVLIQPTFNYGSVTEYNWTALKINIIVGGISFSGTKKAIDVQFSGTSYFYVDNIGGVVSRGIVLQDGYNSNNEYLTCRTASGSTTIAAIASDGTFTTLGSIIGAGKGITRTASVAGAGTVAWTVTNTDLLDITASGNFTIGTPSGTPVNGQKITVRVYNSSGGVVTITPPAGFRFGSTFAALETVPASKTYTFGLIYNTLNAANKYDVVGSAGSY